MNGPGPASLPPNKTRIVATIGPASSSPDVLQRMIDAGMNVARLNFSHGEFAVHQQNILNLRAAARASGRPLAIMADPCAKANCRHSRSRSRSRKGLNLPGIDLGVSADAVSQSFVEGAADLTAVRQAACGWPPTISHREDRTQARVGAFAILTQRPSANDPESNHRMEIINL